MRRVLFYIRQLLKASDARVELDGDSLIASGKIPGSTYKRFIVGYVTEAEYASIIASCVPKSD